MLFADGSRFFVFHPLYKVSTILSIFRTPKVFIMHMIALYVSVCVAFKYNIKC